MDALARVALSVGRPAARALLPLICAYFIVVLAAGAARVARLSRARPRPRRTLARHLRPLPLLRDDDPRPRAVAGRPPRRYDISIDGVDALDEALRDGRGALLVGAHYGSFELLRVLATTRPGLRVRALMHPHNDRKLAAVLGAARERPSRPDHRARPARDDARGARCAGRRHRRRAAGRPRDHGRRHDRAARSSARRRASRAGRSSSPRCWARRSCCSARPGRAGGATTWCSSASSGSTRATSTPRSPAMRRGSRRACRRSPENWFNFYDFWAP